jgi:hypothetical protein
MSMSTKRRTRGAGLTYRRPAHQTLGSLYEHLVQGLLTLRQEGLDCETAVKASLQVRRMKMLDVAEEIERQLERFAATSGMTLERLNPLDGSSGLIK